jgi:probable rRNA maturation factor
VLRRALVHLAHKGRHSLFSDGQFLNRIEVSVLLVNDARMRKLNHLYRGVDKTTDVLSFPQIIDPSQPPLELRGGWDGSVFLGDIVISLPQAKRQSKQYLTTFSHELARLLVHGLLHLLGCDHERNSYQAAKMRRLEAEIREVLCL